MLQRAVPLGGPPLRATQIGPGQCKRYLMRHELIIGQPLPGGAVGSEVCHGLRAVGLAQCIYPIGPALFGFLSGINPFGQLGQLGKRSFAGLGHGFLCHAGGQGVDRFKTGDFGRVVFTDGMIGMHHLRHAIKLFDLSGNNPPASRREQS